MKRLKLILNDLEFRMNRLACQNPLCFPPKYKSKRFTVTNNKKIFSGGKDLIGHFYRNIDGEGYGIGMALSNAAQWTDRDKNFLPSIFDQKILLGILSLAIKNGEYHIDFPSTYALLKKLDIQPNIINYEKIWDSLGKWSKTVIIYKKTIRLYDKDNRKKKETLFVSSVLWASECQWYKHNDGTEEETLIRLRFTPEFLKLLGIKFSEKSLYKPILKLNSSVSHNLYLYLMGISGFLENGKIVKRNIKELCINKLAINKNTQLYRMKEYLINAINNINKSSDKFNYEIEIEDEIIYFKDTNNIKIIE